MADNSMNDAGAGWHNMCRICIGVLVVACSMFVASRMGNSTASSIVFWLSFVFAGIIVGYRAARPGINGVVTAAFGFLGYMALDAYVLETGETLPGSERDGFALVVFLICLCGITGGIAMMINRVKKVSGRFS